MTNVDHLIDDPNYLAYKFDFTKESIEFLCLAAGDIDRVTWLARDSFDLEAESVSVPLFDVVSSLQTKKVLARKPPKFIFHTAYCASTYLARCLSFKGVSVSLREPQILLDAANAKRLQWRSQSCNIDFRHLPALALRLLQKHAEPHETLIIKPVNSVNNIIVELMQAAGPSKALILYTDARNFLLSTLKKGEEAKQRQRAMFDLLRCDFPHLSQLGVSDAIHMSDLKMSLTLWRLQLEQAENMLASSSLNQMVGSLYSETIIKNSALALKAANKFLELGISNDDINGIAEGDLSSRDAKDINNDFSVSKRDSRYQEIEKFYGSDLDNGYKWLVSNNSSTSLVPTLSAALNI